MILEIKSILNNRKFIGAELDKKYQTELEKLQGGVQ